MGPPNDGGEGFCISKTLPNLLMKATNEKYLTSKQAIPETADLVK
jgi:hypothetical protein